MIKVKELRDRIISELKGVYSDKENINLADIIIQFCTGIEKYQAMTSPDLVIETHHEQIILQKLTELKQFKPVQYIMGRAFFCDLELEVSPAVLIPRPETEELVKWISDDHAGVKGLKILDIGTGSGCIIISLGKKLEGSELTALDVSEDAIRIAMRNAGKYTVPVHFYVVDIHNEKACDQLGSFDIIVSNPPYVRNLEKEKMRPNVIDYEPGIALFVPDKDPLVFYRTIGNFAKKHLGNGGKLYFEINENLGQEVVRLLFKDGFGEVTLRKDMQGKDRMVSATLNYQSQIYKQ